MDQNTSFDPIQSSGQQDDRSKVPPPPPSYDQQVGVRSMASDMQSIQQSGGESPQSQILSAQDVFKSPQQDQSQFIPPATPMSAVPPPPMPDIPGMMPQAPDQQQVVMEPPVSHGSPLKTILTIFGIVIVAAGVGYGVYYLVNSLNSGPAVPAVPAFSPNPALSEEPTPAASTPSPLSHSSLIPNPAKSESIPLTMIALGDFKTALSAVSARESMLVGTVKDLSFVTEAGVPVSSEQFLTAFFPSAAANISFLFEQDFTAWLYGDRVGGNKFGVVFGVKQGISAEQLTASLSLLEGNTSDISNMFVSSVSAAGTSGFEGAPIDGIPVRYLVLSSKNQQVFEYASVQIGGKMHVIITTSYYQMQHILNLLNAQPVATTPTV